MPSGSRRGRGRGIDVWPGYVDALSALLILVIFVLLLFTFAQFVLSDLLSSQETELDVLHERIVELTDLLGLEQEKTEQLETNVTQLSDMVSGLTEEKFELSGQVQDLTAQNQAQEEAIRLHLLNMASLQEDIASLRQLRAELEAQVGSLAANLQQRELELGAERDRSKSLQAQLADATERTLLAQVEIKEQDIRIQALNALVGEQKTALKEQRELSASAKAEVALLAAKLDQLEARLEEVGQALAAAEADKQLQQEQIKDLGKRLNLALARKVNQLEKYRSEFFGRLQELLGDNPAVRIVGDRFLFQSELLFSSGSADLGAAGKQELKKLAGTLREVAKRIPENINWILRVDGHTDRVPINTPQYASNWELSTARAVSVVRFLAEQNIPEKRLSAAGFGEFHPLDAADTAEAYARNRRIEIKLTSQ